MKHIRTICGPRLTESKNGGGCGECQASCQSACKTSCTVGNQKCERKSIFYKTGSKAKQDKK